jgi:hypothetical protein
VLRRVITYDRLKTASFVHSAIYVVLLTVWLVPGLHGAEFVFGMAHGVGWIVMSLVCLAAVRLRVISLRLAVAVVVLGGVGPFFGTAEFVREGRRRSDAGSPARVSPQWQ